MEKEMARKVTDEDKFVLEIWKKAIETQEHFNDLIVKNRTAGLSIVYGFIAAGAGFYKSEFISLGISIWVLAFFLLIGFFILDYFYYFRMLVGSVKFTQEIGKRYRNKFVSGDNKLNIFGFSDYIIREVEGNNEIPGKPRSSKFICAIYFLVLFGSIISILVTTNFSLIMHIIKNMF